MGWCKQLGTGYLSKEVRETKRGTNYKARWMWKIRKDCWCSIDTPHKWICKNQVPKHVFPFVNLKQSVLNFRCQLNIWPRSLSVLSSLWYFLNKSNLQTRGKFYSQSIFSRFCLMMLNDFHVSSFSTFLLTEIRRSHHLVFSSSKQRICLESMGWPPGVAHVKGKVTKLSFGLQGSHSRQT